MSSPIHYETHGKGETDIVICNGLSQSTANWRGIARRNHQFRWILFDARGHGRSLVRKRPYHLDDHVADLSFVLEHTGCRKPVLMGFSHGARVALRAVAKQPHLFSCLILASCGARRDTHRKAYLQSWEHCLKLGGVRAMAWAALPTIVGRKILDHFPDLEFLVKAMVIRNQEEGLLAMFEGMASYPPAEEDARKVSLPTLLIRGAEDPLVEERDLEDLASWIQGARKVSFRECGHTLPLEEPEWFLEGITRFITSVQEKNG